MKATYPMGNDLPTFYFSSRRTQMRTITLDKIVERDAQDVIQVGKRHGCTFIKLPFTGKITEPKVAIGWVYYPFEDDDTQIPEEGIRRLRILHAAGVRACQVIIGHEIEVAEEPQTADKEEKQFKISPLAVAGVIATVALGAVVVGALAAPAAVAAPVVAPVVAPSLSTLGAVGLLSGAVLVDPSLVIVCEGSEQWIQVYSWVLGSE
jgi:hypothetical protein